MGKYFNITGVCIPDLHYMVNIDGRLAEIKRMVDRGDYFVINRGRQYGKTTTLHSLRQALTSDYFVLMLSFEAITEKVFENENTFCRRFLLMLHTTFQHEELGGIPLYIREECEKLIDTGESGLDFWVLDEFITRLCKESGKPVVLMIDEVDSAGNHQVFLSFLALLRKKFLERSTLVTFQSVILAGVYDIKNLKLKIRKDDERHYNSPWNIAAKFNVDMRFSADGIAGMLEEYEKKNQTGMLTNEISGLIRDYTSGYPVLVSMICKIMDEDIPGSELFPDLCSAWTKEGFFEAIRLLVNDTNLLFDDMIKKILEYPELYTMLHDILFLNQKYSFNINTFEINLGFMFGFIDKNSKNNAVVIANRIFEMMLNMFFLSEAEFKKTTDLTRLKNINQFTKNGYLNMDLVIKKFAEYYTEVYRDNDQSFLEKNGCKIFLMHLKQIINGTGNYYREAQTFDNTQMDIVVDYMGKQHVIELKIWRGAAYHEDGESQICHYLDKLKLDKGYMLIFNYNKGKTTGTKLKDVNGKIISETMI